MSKKVIVLGETRDSSLRNVSFEAVAAAKTVAEGGEVIGVVFGESVAEAAKELIHYGADRVIVVENEQLKQYSSDGYTQALMAVIDQEAPEGIILGHTSLGKDLAPRVTL